MNDIDTYLKEQATDFQKTYFTRVQKIVKELAPEAVESISYGIPTFKLNGRPLLYFGAFADHMSLFPAGDNLSEAIPETIEFRTGKGTLQFTEKNPISDDLIRKIVEHRLKNIPQK